MRGSKPQMQRLNCLRKKQEFFAIRKRFILQFRHVYFVDMVHLWAAHIFCLYLDIDGTFEMLLEVWTIIIKYVMTN